jgi:hypothetical protein
VTETWWNWKRQCKAEGMPRLRAKPKAVQYTVESASLGHYSEMFARRKRHGWHHGATKYRMTLSKCRLTMVNQLLFACYETDAIAVPVGAAGRETGTVRPPAVNEYWISPRASKAVGVPLGTSANLLDGSTYTNFDHNMQSLPPHSTIHLLPGTYQTTGGYGWGPKTGQHIVDAGMGVTVLQFPAAMIASNACFNDWLITPQSPDRQTTSWFPT